MVANAPIHEIEPFSWLKLIWHRFFGRRFTIPIDAMRIGRVSGYSLVASWAGRHPRQCHQTSHQIDAAGHDEVAHLDLTVCPGIPTLDPVDRRPVGAGEAAEQVVEAWRHVGETETTVTAGPGCRQARNQPGRLDRIAEPGVDIFQRIAIETKARRVLERF